MNHLRRGSKVCKHNVLLRGPLLSEEQASLLDDNDKDSLASAQKEGKRRHHASIPVVQMHGPLQPIILDDSKLSCHHEPGVGHNYLR